MRLVDADGFRMLRNNKTGQQTGVYCMEIDTNDEQSV